MTPQWKADAIRTTRLELRKPALRDAQEIFESYAADPEVTRYLAWKPHQSVCEAQEFLAGLLQRIDSDEVFAWVIREPPNPVAIGMIELRTSGREGSVGYVLAKQYWGRGLMLEALNAVLDFAQRLGRLQSVSICCDVDNQQSARVLEKAGLRYIGVRRSDLVHPAVSCTPRDVHVFERPLRER